ncbi:aryl-alcohol dehydrogenase-like predicted oxidoreductase [Nocardia transvalensis]|uniref:Aryl-alcohol dehydrogenase-like predicted oxidoreductase n=1 Tax=Nocardia transvalensis TaxID=37333 RepID=A0A7W9PI55_9NOCA|nr:aldo/keto reductase [Nocardia transvalensis]MBB5916497.1 aryl-alcohol dehydrogenase-like predicted oxidoreductase [Nocardia transvalensis]
MEQRAVGRSGLRVSRMGLATHTWGKETDDDEAGVQLVAFVEAGGTLVDTSPAYHGGSAQRVLGTLIGELVPRDDLVISGCAGLSAVPGVTDPDGAPAAEIHWSVDASRRTLMRQLDRTLADLGTDYLDLWSVAAWDPRTPLDEIAATVEYAVRSGRVRYAGVRGHNAWQLATLASAAPITAAQGSYSLLGRGVERDVVPAAAHHGVGLIAASPLAGGILTGKYRDGVPADSRGADERTAEEIRDRLDDHAARVVDALLTAADGLGTSPLAVALAWIRDRPGVASMIAGARDIGQLTGILAAETLELPRAIAAALDDVSGG